MLILMANNKLKKINIKQHLPIVHSENRIWQVADEELGEIENMLGLRSRWKRKGDFFSYSYQCVGGAGKFLVFLCLIKVNLIDYLR